MSRFVGAVVLGLSTLLPTLGAAQSGGGALPAEFPPADYDGNQYVDSAGCAFIRAGVSGVTNWVPRMSRAREQLCGFQPTFATPPAPDPAPVTAEADPAPIAVPAAIDDGAEPEEVAQASARAPRADDPTPTVASIVTPPNLGTQANAPAPTDAPASRPDDSAPVARPETITLAQACDGRTGVQPRYISARTGEPIDCGPGSVTPGMSTPTVDAPSSGADGALRLTLGEICLRAARDGTRFVDANTGEPVDCPPAPSVVASAGPGVAATPAAPAAPGETPRVVSAGDCASPRLAGVARADVRCGPQAQSPSGTDVASVAPANAAARAPAGAALSDSVPASNPVAPAAVPAPAEGYRAAWNDGRVNPQRGVAAAAAPEPTPEARLATRTAPAAVTGHRYVQVGTYGNPANADRAAARLRGMGLPVGFANITRNGQALKVVAAGPFDGSNALQAALRAARAAGYSDAFTRN